MRWATRQRARTLGLRARVRDLLFRRSAELETEEEFRFHVEMAAAANVRAGMDPATARRQALLAFGGPDRHRERLRDGRRLPLLEGLLMDGRFALRSLRRNRALALMAALTIALGVGATTAVFSIVNAALLRPLPIPQVEGLTSIQESRSGVVSTGVEGMLLPYPRYRAYREGTGQVFADLAAHRLETFALRLPGATLSVSGSLTSGNYFRTLGVQPVLGRTYTSDDAAEVVISHDLWLARFGGDRDVLGRTVGVDGRQVSVVGVAPPGFRGATFMADALWVPVGIRDLPSDSWDLRMVPLGRLHPRVSFERAAAVVDGVGRSVPSEEGTEVRAATLEPLRAVPEEGRAVVTGFLAMLLGMALLVLLIAAANIAGVMLARGFARRRELAVRQALGAARRRLVRHLQAEGLLVFGAGGVGGVLLAYLGTAWLARMPLPPQVPVVLELAPDLRVMAFAILLTGLTGVLFSMAPALRSSRVELVPSLKAGAPGSVGGGARLRQAFVGAQVAFAVLLLLTAVLFGRSLRAGLRADLGFDPHGVVAARIDLGAPLDYDQEEREAFFRTLLERAEALPGVQSAALAQYTMLGGNRSSATFHVGADPESRGVNVRYSSISPELPRTLRLRLQAGRGFTAADDAGSEPVAIINAALAEALFPGENPLGRTLHGGFSPGAFRIVGVTETARYVFVTEDPAPFLFVPAAQQPRTAMSIHIRAPGAEAAALRGLAEAVRRLDPDVALGTPAPLRETIGFGLFPQRFAAQLVGAFGVVGLILAALGIYGVLAYHVGLRTRELGIRRALGASRGSLVRGVMGRGGWIAAAGCVIGVASGAGLSLLLRSLLYGIRPLDPVTFVGVPVVLLLVALVASWVPAMRASRVEPLEALRAE